MEYDNTNRGAIFANKRKTDGDRKPDYTGEIDVSGVSHWVSAWLAKSKSGDTYMQLSVRPKDDQPQQAASSPHQVYSNSTGFSDLETDPERPF